MASDIETIGTNFLSCNLFHPHEEIHAVFFGNGTGRLVAPDCVECDSEMDFVHLDECFSHGIDFAGFRSMEHDERDERLRDVFYVDINPTLENRLVKGVAEFSSAEFDFTKGNEDDLARLTELAIRSDPDISDMGGRIYFLAATDDSDAEIDEDSISSGIPPRVVALCRAALKANVPVGHRYVYNDGARGRASGYGHIRQTVTVNVTPSSAHQRLAAMQDILPAYLEAGLGDDEDVIAYLGAAR